jgi:hypothetical protein
LDWAEGDLMQIKTVRIEEGLELGNLFGWGLGHDPLSYGVMIDNAYTYWFQVIIDTIVPYYPLVYDAFLGAFFTSLSQNLLGFAFGPNRMSLKFAAYMNVGSEGWNFAFKKALEELGELLSVDQQELASFAQMVMVGHGAAGLIAKALALNHNWYGVSFESTQYERSPIEAFFASNDTRPQNNIFNFYSEDSFLVLPEPESRLNYKMPAWQSYFRPAETYETMCLLMAGCVSDDRFDALCSDLVGFRQYQRYFQSWGRRRLDDLEDESSNFTR